ncbi:MAG: hypothetical protein GY730_04925 [bacterium]|nr:hypothetical protein [bacterium]
MRNYQVSKSKDEALEQIKELIDSISDENLRQEIIDFVFSLYELCEKQSQ